MESEAGRTAAPSAPVDAPPWAEPARKIAEILNLEDPRRGLGASDAFQLKGDDSAWLVLSGHVDVFYVTDAPADQAQGEYGTRHFVTRVPAGGLALGMTTTSSPLRLLAVPSNGADIAETSRRRMRTHALRDAAALDALIQGVADWITSLSTAMLAGPLVHTALKLDADKEIAIPAGTVINAKTGPLWIAAEPGAFALPDGSLADDSGGVALQLPITKSFSLRALKDITVTPRSMQEWIASEHAHDDITRLHQRLLANYDARITKLKKEEASETAQKKDFDRRAFGISLRQMANIFSPKSGEGVTLAADPLIAAAGLVCAHNGIRLQLSDASQKRIQDSKHAVDSLTAESGLRLRRIRLAGEWWSKDAGPILAFYGEEKKPCALLPQSPRTYRLADPEAEHDVAVTAEIAPSIDEAAYSFYTPFPPGKITPWQLLRFSFQGSARDGWTIVAMILLGGLLSLGLPLITGWIMDPVIPEAQTNLLTVLVLGLVVLGVSMTGFSLVQAIAMLRIEGHMENTAQAAVWDRLLNLPASFFRGFSVGDLANRAQGIDAIRSLLTSSMTAVIVHATYGLFSLGLMFYYDWVLTVSIALISVLYGVVAFFIGRKVLSRNRDILRLQGRIQGLVLQLLGAVTKLRVSGSERRAFARWSGQYSELLSITYHQRLLNNALVVIKALFRYIMITSAIVIIGIQGDQLFAIFRTPTNWAEIATDSLQLVMPAATFVAFNVALGQFMTAVFGVSETAIQLLNVGPLYERIRPIFQESIEAYEGIEDPGELSGNIEVHQVDFRYQSDRPLVLDGVSLRAHPGEMVALVGPSGAGKSSLVRLLLGFDTPESGSILYDGMDLRQLEKRALRRNFGVVLQNSRLLSGSIFKNITAGANLTRNDAMEAARLAGLDKDIAAMPMGLDTFLSEGANTLSGGQRQRLMIARAIVRRPSILIFDEATSALDNETQSIVTRGLETLNCTRFVIAHRLSTIVNADRIYVLAGGKIVEDGTFSTLMDANGTFAQLARRQIA